MNSHGVTHTPLKRTCLPSSTTRAKFVYFVPPPCGVPPPWDVGGVVVVGAGDVCAGVWVGWPGPPDAGASPPGEGEVGLGAEELPGAGVVPR